MIEMFVLRTAAAARARAEGHASERGDVPGWVLITVMTAGLVAALWAVAGDTLSQMLTEALGSVSS
jgi:hypothetical protein